MTDIARLPVSRFTEADADRAHAEWGCNCGPGALAGICGLSLDGVRPFMGDFESKGYTNPTLMLDCLRRLEASGIRWTKAKDQSAWPSYGLARIQWEGPWTAPKVPPRVAYRHTHWVGACVHTRNDVGIFDINCVSNGTGWVSLKGWTDLIVPVLLENVPKASRKWHITYVIEVTLPVATRQ